MREMNRNHGRVINDLPYEKAFIDLVNGRIDVRMVRVWPLPETRADGCDETPDTATNLQVFPKWLRGCNHARVLPVNTQP